MRIAIISDIHGNCVALESVLKDLESADIDHMLCLGDVATDGPQPCEVIAQLKILDIPVIMGNMDAWLLDPPARSESPGPMEEIQFWGLGQLSPDHFDYLQSFQATIEIPLNGVTNLLCYHGSPRSNEKGISANTSNENVKERLAGHYAAVLAGGHTHRQMFRRYGDMILLNPGTVGAPMPPNNQECLFAQEYRPLWAEYAIVGSSEHGFSAELRRVPIDRNMLIEAAIESNMPNSAWWVNLRYDISL